MARTEWMLLGSSYHHLQIATGFEDDSKLVPLKQRTLLYRTFGARTKHFSR